LYRSVPLSSLHSFPTRRSSDLYLWGRVEYRGAAILSKKILGFLISRTCECPIPTLRNEPGPGSLLRRAGQGDREPRALDAIHIRSEEHTSELQSRFDLVCRLLL